MEFLPSECAARFAGPENKLISLLIHTLISSYCSNSSEPKDCGNTLSTEGIGEIAGSQNWVSSSPDSLIPPLAVIGELGSDGSPTYVGRSFHEGGIHPARVISKKHFAYISWGGSQIKKTNFEILVGENYRFVNYSADAIPLSAVRAGNTANGEPLWVGRGIIDGNQIIGKIHPIHRCLFVAYNGEEHRLDSYEVLIHELPQSHTWVRSNINNVTRDAVVAGYDTKDKPIIYVGRAYHEGEVLPAKVIPQAGAVYISYHGQDYLKEEFEVLVGDGYSWEDGKHSGDNIPIGAVSTGKTRDGKLIYVGRGPHRGSLTPGKVFAGDYAVYIPFEHEEHKIMDYQILVKKK